MREMNTRLMKVFEDIASKDAVDSDIKRENANINGDTAMGSYAQVRLARAPSSSMKCTCWIPSMSEAHRDGDIHIHDLDFLHPDHHLLPDRPAGSCSTAASPPVTACCGSPTTSTAIPRWPASPFRPTRTISTAARASSNFDYGMAQGVKKTYRKRVSGTIWIGRWSCWAAWRTRQMRPAPSWTSCSEAEFGLAPDAGRWIVWLAEKVAELLPDAAQDELMQGRWPSLRSTRRRRPTRPPIRPWRR